MRACHEGFVDRVVDIVLVQCSADPNVCDPLGYSALMRAAEGGHVSCIEALLCGGAHVNKQHNENGVRALMLASKAGNTEAVKKLLRAGAEINCNDNRGWTPLMFAAINGRTLAVKALIHENANINLVTKDGDTAFDLAVSRGHELTATAIREAIQIIEKNEARKRIQANINQAPTKLRLETKLDWEPEPSYEESLKLLHRCLQSRPEHIPDLVEIAQKWKSAALNKQETDGNPSLGLLAEACVVCLDRPAIAGFFHSDAIM